MKIWKKIVSLLLSISMICTVLPITAFAEERRTQDIVIEDDSSSKVLKLEKSGFQEDESQNTVEEAEAEDTLRGSKNGANSVDRIESENQMEEIPNQEESEENLEPKENTKTMLDYGVPLETGDCSKSAEDNVIWTVYDSDDDNLGDTLVIEGIGEMKDYSFSASGPWGSYKESLETLILCEGIVNIGNNSFMNYFNLSGDLILPRSLKSIGDYAFYDCRFNGELVIPEGVTSIGKSAFYSCDFYGDLVFPNSVTYIGEVAFGMCLGFTGKLEIPNNLATIEARTFMYCYGLEEVSIPDSVTAVGEEAFKSCTGLTGDLIIPDSVESIGKQAFSYCYNLNGNLKLSEKLRRIEDSTFWFCGFTGDLVIPDSVKHIGESAFHTNKFNGILKLPENLEVISNSAFSGCKYLNGDIRLGNSIKFIGIDAFEDCSNFKTIVIQNIECNIASGENTIPSNIKIYGYENSTAQAYAEKYERKFIKDHSYNCEIKKATCVETGLETYRCFICGDVYTKIIPTTEHTKIVDKAVPPTCTVAGKTEGSHCSACGKVLENQQEIQALDHDFGDWRISLEPTFESEGIEVRTCKRCNEEESRKVPKLDITVPDTPEIEIDSLNSFNIRISWNNISEKVWYEVYRAPTILGEYKLLQEVSSRNNVVTIDLGVEMGFTYYYKVRAVSSQNGQLVYGEYSECKSWRTEIPNLTGLSAKSAGVRKVSLSWDNVSGVDGYLIYTQKEGKYGYCGMTTMGASYTDLKALDSEYNFYWVYPYVIDNLGKRVIGKCTKYVYAKGVTLSVNNLKATSQKGSVKLTWTKSAGAEGYLIYGKTESGKYGYISMTTLGTTYIHKSASATEWNFYWIFPYHRDKAGKMIIGNKSNYVYGKAK